MSEVLAVPVPVYVSAREGGTVREGKRRVGRGGGRREQRREIAQESDE